jgi:hypothetical protein
MSPWQLQQLEDLIKARCPDGFSHGSCVGADVQAHALVRRIFGQRTFIAVFPSTAPTKAPVPPDANFVAVAKPPLERNPDIVDWGCDLLVAAPLQMREVVRSGTWSAIRYARKRKIPVEILWRD